jgi:hypothetical protein
VSRVLPAQPLPGGYDRRLWAQTGTVADGALTDWISLGVQIEALSGQLTELRAQVAGLAARVRQNPENSSRPPHRRAGQARPDREYRALQPLPSAHPELQTPVVYPVTVKVAIYASQRLGTRDCMEPGSGIVRYERIS